ncbi:MAG TPA: prepilin-type N-terminal cleavage/methylation domain-containing protein [Candidatus Paceibacterota bacterium]|nr:prepilin-type N-terminal cleavage/methylation domain-containing protein [Candidatus Paceibacterota bacterium]
MTSKPKNMRRLVAKARGGFTLIEMLVAVLILSTAIAGPMTIASKSLTTALVAKDQVTAFFLAQDAVEYVRFVRDSNKLKGADWLTGAGGSAAGTDLSVCKSANGSALCYVDSTGNYPATPQTCGSTCPALNYDASQGRFTYSAANPPSVTPTIYTRTVSLTDLSDDEQKLVVTVSWSDTGGTGRSVKVTENIFNWQ